MFDVLDLGWLAGGLVMLVAGAELLVRGASALAQRVRIPPVIIGLTVVAFGTSAPELAISLESALGGRGDLAIGNIIGSNITNVLLILGLSALLAPLVVHRQLIRFDVPLMILASALAWLLAADQQLSRLDGGLLAAAGVIYLAWLIRAGRQAPAEAVVSLGSPWREAVRVVVGLLLLAVGARWMVAAAVRMATTFGVSELIVGLTVVAVGTSLPEVATSLIATVRGERDVAVGNVIGSNLLNLLLVLAVAALVTPTGIPVRPAAVEFDFPVMVAVAAACLPIFFTAHRIDRWEGLLFVGYWLAYTLYLFLDQTGHESSGVYRTVMLEFVVPLTAVTLLVLAWRARGTPVPPSPS